MSIHAVEKVFWEFGNEPERIGRFFEDPDRYLSGYNLTDGERAMIRDVDLKGLADSGVSTLLTMMVWPMMKGAEGMPFDYLAHMNGGQMPAIPGMPPVSAGE